MQQSYVMAIEKSTHENACVFSMIMVYNSIQTTWYSLQKKHDVYKRLGDNIIRIKSGEPGFPGFSVPGKLGGVICKPEGTEITGKHDRQTLFYF